MNPFLKQSLDIIKKFNRHELDAVILIGGAPGVGKSTIAQQVAGYLDETFDESRLAFTALEYANQVIKLKDKPGSSIIYDEAQETLSSLKTTTKKTRETLILLDKIRFLRLYSIIIIPNLFRTPVDVVRRSFCYIQPLLYFDKKRCDFSRGYFNYFSYKDKLKYYYALKKGEAVNGGGISTFHGKFNKVHFIDPKLYNELKIKSIEDSQSQINFGKSIQPEPKPAVTSSPNVLGSLS